ncbi:MAG: hypothetical protein ABSH09_19660 [Bryobacteraceae bacterium]
MLNGPSSIAIAASETRETAIQMDRNYRRQLSEKIGRGFLRGDVGWARPGGVQGKNGLDRVIVQNGRGPKDLILILGGYDYDPQMAVPAFTFVFTFMVASPFFFYPFPDTHTKAITVPLSY